MVTSERPIRVLHVIGHLAQGGVETWLINVLEHVDRARIQMDFLVGTDTPGAYDERARACGAKILPCRSPSRPLRYAREFRRIVTEHGPYDVVHSHIHHFSGYVQLLAARHGVPMRITQSHLAEEAGPASIQRRAYVTLMRRLITRYSTDLLAVSDVAGATLFGPDWRADSRSRRLPCGIDLAPFSIPVSRAAVRDELGLPRDAFVVGHVGAFRPQKNHPFLLSVFAEVLRRRPDAWLLLVGSGPTEAEIRALAGQLGISDRTIFAGGRQDVARILLGAPDVFLFPSLFEGLGLALVEAQAAALPCVISDVITTEADLIPDLITRKALSDPVESWASAVLDAPSKTLPQAIARDTVARSPMNLETGLEALIRLYSSARAGKQGDAVATAPLPALVGSSRRDR